MSLNVIVIKPCVLTQMFLLSSLTVDSSCTVLLINGTVLGSTVTGMK